MILPAVFFAVLSLTPGTAAVAPSWDAPATVQASGSGYFEGEGVFTAGTGGSAHDYASAMPLENTNCCGWIADGFCLDTIAEGEQIEVDFSGYLIDLHKSASVMLTLGVCNNGSGWTEEYGAVVEILAPKVSTGEFGFGMVKASFRD